LTVDAITHFMLQHYHWVQEDRPALLWLPLDRFCATCWASEQICRLSNVGGLFTIRATVAVINPGHCLPLNLRVACSIQLSSRPSSGFEYAQTNTRSLPSHPTARCCSCFKDMGSVPPRSNAPPPGGHHLYLGSIVHAALPESQYQWQQQQQQWRLQQQSKQ
jgi:hypothetical protein